MGIASLLDFGSWSMKSVADRRPDQTGRSESESRPHLSIVGGRETAAQDEETRTGPPTSSGVLAHPLLQAFFAGRFFGLGFHNGSNFCSTEALQQGKSELVAKFSNLVWAISEERSEAISRLRMGGIEVAGVSDSLADQFRQRVSDLQAQVEACERQIQLASEHRGWIEAALHEYQQGFRAGLTNSEKVRKLLGL